MSISGHLKEDNQHWQRLREVRNQREDNNSQWLKLSLAERKEMHYDAILLDVI